MHNDYHEDWDDNSDDWYDGADELLLNSRRFFLQKCFDLPSSQKEKDDG